MILTEEQAKTKRCQESFAAAEGLSMGGYVENASMTIRYPYGADGPGFATGGAGYARVTAPTHCIGTACMAWRWHDDEEEIDIFRSGETDADFAKRRDLVLSRRRGYCGKPGRPSP